MVRYNARALKRARGRCLDHYLVSIDQSFTNYAMVLWKNGIPIDRVVHHTGDGRAAKNAKKDEELTNNKFFDTDIEQLCYLYDQVIDVIADWNPTDIVMEGLSFNSKGCMERQLGGLYFGIQVSLIRELNYKHDEIHWVGPQQVKSIAREFLTGQSRYQYNKKTKMIETTKKGNKVKNRMSGKSFIIEALKNTPYNWLVDGYTRDGLVKSRKVQTGLEDLPDAFFIGLYCLENRFKLKRLNRPED